MWAESNNLYKGYVSVVNALIDKHGCSWISSNSDKTLQVPLRYNEIYSIKDLVSCLISNLGYDINWADAQGKTLLHHACYHGHLDMVRMLVSEFKADVNIDTMVDGTPLHTALAQSRDEVAEALIVEFGCSTLSTGVMYLAYSCHDVPLRLMKALLENCGVIIYCRRPQQDHLDMLSYCIDELGVNWVDKYGKTLLHHACYHGDLEMVRMLVSKFKADVNIDMESGGTPLHTALAQSRHKVAVALISKFGCNTCDMGVIYLICKNKLLDVIEALVGKHGQSIFKISSGYNEELRVHVEYRTGDLVSHLIDQLGSDHKWTNKCGRALLDYACCHGYLDMLKMLVSKFKVSVNKIGIGNSLLHSALNHSQGKVALALITEFGCVHDREVINMSCRQGLVCVVKGLVSKHGVAVLGGPNSHFNGALMLAVEYGREEMMTYLISQLDFDVNSRDGRGWSLLHFICKHGHEHLAETLICQYKADINVFNDKRNSPLHEAVRHGKEMVAIALINKFGCDPSITGYLGRSVLHYACISGNSSLLRSLTKYVSPLNMDDNGNTPLHYACEHNSWECAQVLLECKAPVLVRNNAGQTPQDKAAWFPSLLKLLDKYIEDNKAKIFTNYDAIHKHAKKKYASASRITRVFVIGHPGAGKSSLIETFKREGFMDWFRRVSSRSVPLHTAGIIPSSHVSKRSGKVLFYDFAGNPEYYSSHAAILENIASSRKGDSVFIIVVDLREKNALNILHYWHSFVQHQQFLETQRPSLIVVGSHLDLIAKDVVEMKEREFHTFLDAIQCGAYHVSEYFLLDCCQPKSKQIADIHDLVCKVTEDSPQYGLSPQSSMLLGLLEMDFSNVPACSAEVLLPHIEKTGLLLPTALEGLSPLLHELHDLGLLFIVGDCRSEGSTTHLVLNVAKLTNIVHKILFSEFDNPLKRLCRDEGYSFNIGIIPKHILSKVLPENITKECLIQLQYCQEISHKDVHIFQHLTSSDSTDQSFLFFPALCSADKSDVEWATPPGLSCGVGWLARCTDPHDYFPPRFLHVLLLRLVFRFTLSLPTQALSSVSPKHSCFQRRCTMWKTGVHWLMEEGVECMVELVDAGKEVVVITKCEDYAVENCTSVFQMVVSCVMDAKAEFCHSVKPQFFLIDSDAGYPCEDSIFAMSDVEEALKFPEGKKDIISVTGKRKMKLEKILSFTKFTHWYNLFPIDFTRVLDYLKDIVKELYTLGLHLGIRRGLLDALDTDFPTDASQRRRELVKGWMSSSQELPCWYQLVQALRQAQNSNLAEEIKEEHSVHIQLQEKLLEQQYHDVQPDENFLALFAGVVGSKWPSLAASLSLSQSEMEEVKGEGHSQQDRALKMLEKWVLKQGTTYGQLYQTLRARSLFSV